MNKLVLVSFLILATILLITSCMSREGAEQDEKKKFKNTEVNYQSGFGDFISIHRQDLKRNVIKR